MNVVVDTSTWINFFRKLQNPFLEESLQEGRVFITPIVLAELLSGESKPSREQNLLNFLLALPFVPTPVEHWIATGQLRRRLATKGMNISMPDAHIARAALDAKALLLTQDRIFMKIAPLIGLRVQG